MNWPPGKVFALICALATILYARTWVERGWVCLLIALVAIS